MNDLAEKIDYTPFSSGTLPSLVSGQMEVRLATTPQEVEDIQALRYKVFYDECGAIPGADARTLNRDFDPIDKYCDHLLVIDHNKGDIVGTYRFLRRNGARAYGAYYTASEFEIEKLLRIEGEIMELGRSCVHKDYRSRSTMQLLWRGVGAYAEHHNVKALFGCASFQGTDIDDYRHALAYLYHNHLAPENIRTRALERLYQDMDLMPANQVDTKRAIRLLPPLIKGYIRLGGFIGEGAVIDEQFNTIDVCIIVQSDLMANRYAQRYRNVSGVPDGSPLK
jgi:putative hemolysin